ncbi:hypothetical protein, partial [Acidithiobacillus thiooxidans]
KTGIKILSIHHFAQILRDGILKNALFLSGTIWGCQIRPLPWVNPKPSSVWISSTAPTIMS